MRICFVGDSFVNGTGDPSYWGWTGRVCIAAHRQGHNITAYNLGVRGETSSDILNRWFSEVSIRLSSPEEGRVVFSFGVNDTTLEQGKLRVTQQNSLENARHILTEARARFPVLMVGLAPIADLNQNLIISDLSQQFNQICQTLDIPYLNIFSALQASPTWMKEVAENDGAHPREAGYAELAQLVQSWSAWQAWFN